MKKVLLFILLTAAAVLAQPAQTIHDKVVRAFPAPATQGPGAGAFTYMSAETSFEAALVKGVPFTADFVTETTQTLADGNRIKNSNTTSYARDGEGRTRREVTIGMLGALTGGSPHKTIFISDPVAKVDYILDPQAKTVRKINLGTMIPTVSLGNRERREVMVHTTEGPKGGSTMVFDRKDGEEKNIEVRRTEAHSITMERMPLPPGMVIHGELAGVPRQGMAVATAGFAAVPDNVDFKNEKLGKRIIEGVEAEGTRTTLSIPAGQIGNERPLDTISERWYSDELKTVVLTTRTDPRTGESNYKLSNLRRGEPGRQMFEPPPDYTILTEDNVGPNFIRMRVDKKQE